MHWTASRITTIEGGPGSPFHTITDRGVAIGPQQRVIVLDQGAQTVLVFDAGGTFLFSLGRTGRGPGELQAATALTTSGDTVSVVDASTRRIKHFSAEGTFLGESPSPPGLGGGHAVSIGAGLAYVARGRREVDRALLKQLRLVTDTGAVTLTSLTDSLTHSVTYESCGVNVGLGPLFAPDIRWAASGSRIASAVGPDYSIDLYQDGRLAARVTRAIAPLDATRSRALDEIGDGEEWVIGTSRTCTVPPEEVVRKRGYYSKIPVVRELALDPKGWLWVRRAGNSPASEIDVFDAAGMYVGTLAVDFPWPVAFGEKGRFLAIATDTLDVRTVQVYSVDR